MTFDPYASVYASGRAVGEPNIRDDTMTFMFENERYTIPTCKLPHNTYNGYFHEMPIEEVRRLAKE